MSTRGGGRREWAAAGVAMAALGVGLLAVATRGAAGPAPALKPELSRVVKLTGTLRPAPVDGSARAAFTTLDGRWSAVVLEGQIAANLEETIFKSPRPMVVDVTGIVTEYRQQNYLLITAAEARVVGPAGAP